MTLHIIPIFSQNQSVIITQWQNSKDIIFVTDTRVIAPAIFQSGMGLYLYNPNPRPSDVCVYQHDPLDEMDSAGMSTCDKNSHKAVIIDI